MSGFIRPRLNDFHNLSFTQEEVDFAIPFITEDIPLIVDPFLLWKSPSLQDNSLHTAITNCFNHLGYLTNKSKFDEAAKILISVSECDEVGLGNSGKRKGLPIGHKVANEILKLFLTIPQIKEGGFVHFEELQLYVDQVAKDRISDLTCSFAKSFLIDYTIQQCDHLKIPRKESTLVVYDYKRHRLYQERVSVPVCPETDRPILLVPKRWLRFNPWINYDNYFDEYYLKAVLNTTDAIPSRVEILDFNRHNYGAVSSYVKSREIKKANCQNDPLFKAIPIISAKRHLKAVKQLPVGKTENADRKYENHICQLLASLFYPELDFAQPQNRTDSGVLIRDLIFYNNRSHEFLRDIYDNYGSKQIVVELKNVKEIEGEHINQVNRYLKDSFGSFAVIITRHPPRRKIFRNTIDLWSGQRRCILILDDSDIELMCQLYESKQRASIDVLKKKYVEFIRACPG